MAFWIGRSLANNEKVEDAAKRHPAAEPLIARAALLAPEPIPLFLFVEAREKFGQPLATAFSGDGVDKYVTPENVEFGPAIREPGPVAVVGFGGRIVSRRPPNSASRRRRRSAAGSIRMPTDTHLSDSMLPELCAIGCSNPSTKRL